VKRWRGERGTAGQPRRSSGPSGNHSDNLSALFMAQLWRATSDSSFPARSIQSRLGAFPQHGAFEFRVLQ